MHWMFLPLKRYAEFSGRSRRLEYWMFWLFQFIVYFLLVLIAVALGGAAAVSGDPGAMAAAGGGLLVLFVAYFIFWLGSLIPMIAVGVRRLHDTNRSGWWLLAPMAPYLVMILAAALTSASPDLAPVAMILVIVAGIAVLGLGITLLVFLLLEGTRGPNRFGDDPKGPDHAQVFA